MHRIHVMLSILDPRFKPSSLPSLVSNARHIQLWTYTLRNASQPWHIFAQALEIMPVPNGDDVVNVIGVNSACPPPLAVAALPTGPQTPPPPSMLCSYGVIKNVSKL